MFRPLRHLGFVIAEYVTWKQGGRHGYPGPGMCAECEKPRGRTYMRFDDKPYCADCIGFDLASAVVDETVPQRHPGPYPEEMPYEFVKAAGGFDEFELRAVRVPDATDPDPRMYDRALA